MSKIGQAKVLSETEFSTLLSHIKQHRHHEKNTLIMQISFKLGLRVQEIALLQVKHMVELTTSRPEGFILKDILVLPKSLTKGARATQGQTTTPVRTRVSFSIDDFNRLFIDLKEKIKAGIMVQAEDYYPILKKSGGHTRELPLEDFQLMDALEDYLFVRLAKNPQLKKDDPLIISQKGRHYTPNSLQEHMALMLRQWAGVQRASSHSGRRSLATTLLHDHNENVKTVQKILGHQEASTTLIYHDVPEKELRDVMKKVSKTYKE